MQIRLAAKKEKKECSNTRLMCQGSREKVRFDAMLVALQRLLRGVHSLTRTSRADNERPAYSAQREIAGNEFAAVRMNWVNRQSGFSDGFNCIMLFVVAASFIMCFETINAASSNAKVCQSDACEKIATSILQKMDQSVNPCDNFYEFVCGNFTRNSVISPSRSQNDLINQLRDVVLNQLKNNIENEITVWDPVALQKLLMYYKTCMNEEKIERSSRNVFLKKMRSLGSWPVLRGKSYRDSRFNWNNAVTRINKLGYSRNYIFSMVISNDLKNNTKNVLYLDQPVFGISQEYLSQGLENDVVKAYSKYMVDLAEIFGANREEAKLDLAESLKFEIELAKISLPETKRRDIEKMYNPMKISELQSKYPSIPWLQYLNNQLSPYHQLTEDEVVIVAVPSFFESLGDLLDRTPKRALANYLMWRVAADSADQLDQKVQVAKLEFNGALTGNRNKIPRWQSCIRYASSHLHVATSSLYVRRNFDKASKNGVVDMVKHLRQSFKNILLEVDWMDETTRSAALQKLEKIIPLVGYFDESLDNRKINSYYQDLQLCSKSYLTAVLRYKRFANAKELKKFRDPVPRIDWTEPEYASDVVNAFYNPIVNSIQFPAGILQGDLYNEDNPKYVNYASIGSIIGHEMTHGFDDQGCGFDGNGNMVDWWNADTKKEYFRRAKCIVDQYSNYTDPQAGLHLNGDLTQGENIADNGGLKEAYMAYAAFEKENGEEPKLPGFEEFTPRQLFWISYGNTWCAKYRTEYLKDIITTDPHAPNQFRVIGTIMNNPDFAKDFNCPVGSPMNPEKKCSVW